MLFRELGEILCTHFDMKLERVQPGDVLCTIFKINLEPVYRRTIQSSGGMNHAERRREEALSRYGTPSPGSLLVAKAGIILHPICSSLFSTSQDFHAHTGRPRFRAHAPRPRACTGSPPSTSRSNTRGERRELRGIFRIFCGDVRVAFQCVSGQSNRIHSAKLITYVLKSLKHTDSSFDACHVFPSVSPPA